MWLCQRVTDLPVTRSGWYFQLKKKKRYWLMTKMMTLLLVYTFFEWPFSMHTLVLSLGIISSSISFFYLYQQKKIFFFISSLKWKYSMRILIRFGSWFYYYIHIIMRFAPWVLLLHPYYNKIWILVWFRAFHYRYDASFLVICIFFSNFLWDETVK